MTQGQRRPARRPNPDRGMIPHRAEALTWQRTSAALTECLATAKARCGRTGLEVPRGFGWRRPTCAESKRALRQFACFGRNQTAAAGAGVADTLPQFAERKSWDPVAS